MKRFSIFTTLILLCSLPGAVYAQGSSTLGVACPVSESYTESVGSERQEVQYTHLAKAGSLSSEVSYEVELTQSLSLKGGVEGNVNFLVANSSIDFELSSLGSRTVRVTCTWEDIPAGETHLLRAGETFITVTGKKTTRDSSCETSTETTTVEGSVASWHDSIQQ